VINVSVVINASVITYNVNNVSMII